MGGMTDWNIPCSAKSPDYVGLKARLLPCMQATTLAFSRTVAEDANASADLQRFVTVFFLSSGDFRCLMIILFSYPAAGNVSSNCMFTPLQVATHYPTAIKRQ
jgi:hypothetical protein